MVLRPRRRLRNAETRRAPRPPPTVIPCACANEKRYEGKLTYSPTHEPHAHGAPTSDRRHGERNSFGNILDLASLVNQRDAPGPALAQLHRRAQRQLLRRGAVLQRAASRSRARARSSPTSIQGTLLLDNRAATPGTTRPPSAASATPRARDNENYVLKASYFLSTEQPGSHDIVVGVDHFDDKRFVQQLPVGQRLPDLRDSRSSEGRTSSRSSQPRPSSAGRRSSEQPGDRLQHRLAVPQRRLALGPHWSFNLGVRYDKNDGKDASGTVVVRTPP